MELTKEEAQKLFEARFHEYPQMKAVAEGEYFIETLTQILDFEEINQEFLPIIENEVKVILTLYAPLDKLGANITESTGLPLEKGESIAGLIETLVLQPVYNDLLAYSVLWEQELEKIESIPEANKELKDKLELRPENVLPTMQKPLTREDVLGALSPKRTMAGDIASIQEKKSGE